MNFRVSVTAVIYLLIPAVYSDGPVSSLLDLPLKVPRGDHVVYATLTDVNRGNKYFVEEHIRSGDRIEGKIKVTAPQETFDIFYSFPNETSSDTKQRLVIYEADCKLYQMDSRRDTYLPGVKARLTNKLLLMGPSIIYRLAYGSFAWSTGSGQVVRGTTMKSAFVMIKSLLKITEFYKEKGPLDLTGGIARPSRIVFDGHDPSSVIISTKENLILDIYLQSKDSSDHQVSPTPGIGCVTYFMEQQELPALKARTVHFLMNDERHGTLNAKNIVEIHASDVTKMMRIETTLMGMKTEVVFDYNLGISFVFEDGGYCDVVVASTDSPGIDPKDRIFSLNRFFNLNESYMYLGRQSYELRPGLMVKVWESTRYDEETEEGLKYGKTVTTQYFVETDNNDLFDGHLLIGTTINQYNLDSSRKSYKLTQTVVRSYMDMKVGGTESEFHDIFRVTECKDLSKQRKVLNFRFLCKGFECIKFAESHPYELKEEFRKLVLDPYWISPVRTEAIELFFYETYISIVVTLLEIPDLEEVFSAQTISLANETFSKFVNQFSVESESRCTSEFGFIPDQDVFVYSSDPPICGTLSSLNDVKVDDKAGIPCKVFNFPMRNINRIERELPLEEEQKRFLSMVHKKLHLNDERYEYEMADVLDETPSVDTTRYGYPYNRLLTGYKLDAMKDDVLISPGISTVGDCYRACEDSLGLDCSIFSYCSKADSPPVCYISSRSSRDRQYDNEVKDSSCSIYYKNRLLEYTLIPGRRFHDRGSVIENVFLGQCVDLCYTSKDCVAFEVCGDTCALGGAYTDSETEIDPRCYIYNPTVSHLYAETGRDLVADFFHSEIDLNLDQCAALCHSLIEQDQSVTCKSFNFCPNGKSKSSCSISANSVHDPNTRTIKSSSCFNYQLKDPENSSNGKQANSKQSKGVTGGAAFGIIVIFLSIGLLFGMSIPYVYFKISRKSDGNSFPIVNQSFRWSRHVDEPVQS